ncbi:hypothetical protein MMC29_002455 [Sticta canariensis]|nr:hypothetical protein [Sticta canariensis]
MAPNTRSQSTVGGSSSTTGPHADTTRNVTISQANYGILVSQAFETQQQQQATAPVVPAPAPDAEITHAPAAPAPAAPWSQRPYHFVPTIQGRRPTTAYREWDESKGKMPKEPSNLASQQIKSTGQELRRRPDEEDRFKGSALDSSLRSKRRLTSKQPRRPRTGTRLPIAIGSKTMSDLSVVVIASTMIATIRRTLAYSATAVLARGTTRKTTTVVATSRFVVVTSENAVQDEIKRWVLQLGRFY